MSILLAAVLAAASPAAPSATWLQCAQAAVLDDLASDRAQAWPVTGAVPEGVDVRVVRLPSHPSDDAFDAEHRVLYALPARNEAYVASSGGIADFRRVYGPVSLAARCPASVASR